MATGLAIETPAAALRKAGAPNPWRVTRGAQCVAPGARHEFVATPPIGAGDPAAGVRGPARFRSVARPDGWRSRYGWVDALVTFAVMGAFAAALALMAGEWLDAASGMALPAMVTTVAPSTSPHVAVFAVGAGHGSQAL